MVPMRTRRKGLRDRAALLLLAGLGLRRRCGECGGCRESRKPGGRQPLRAQSVSSLARSGYRSLHSQTSLWGYHPAAHCTDHPGDLEDDGSAVSGCACMSPGEAVDDAIWLCVVPGWPQGVAKASIEHICATLTEADSRRAA